jgi:hypothetical protein
VRSLATEYSEAQIVMQNDIRIVRTSSSAHAAAVRLKSWGIRTPGANLTSIFERALTDSQTAYHSGF